jgi:[ribosomal protein S5]-alanine N-acetyltransferase
MSRRLETAGRARETGAVTSVEIVQLSAVALRALADGELEEARRLAPVPLSSWLVSDHPRAVWRRRAVQVVEEPADLGWVTGVLVDPRTMQAVGAGGFHAAPDERGMVEAGYGVDPAFRRQGYARAALGALIARARAEPAVRVFRLTISPDNEPSLALARQFPFVVVGEQWDDEDGLETIFEMPVAGA